MICERSLLHEFCNHRDFLPMEVQCGGARP